MRGRKALRPAPEAPSRVLGAHAAHAGPLGGDTLEAAHVPHGGSQSLQVRLTATANGWQLVRTEPPALQRLASDVTILQGTHGAPDPLE